MVMVISWLRLGMHDAAQSRRRAIRSRSGDAGAMPGRGKCSKPDPEVSADEQRSRQGAAFHCAAGLARLLQKRFLQADPPFERTTL
jgi:hypothetical protein